MKTATTIDTVDATSALNAEYRTLALAAAKGDVSASKKLMALEDRQDAMARSERRQAAATLEIQRLAVEAEEKATADAQVGNASRHAGFLAQREVAFASIEARTDDLAREIALALVIDQELWAASLACGWSPEQRTNSRIVNYVSTALGREGAGLADFGSVYGPLREASLTRQPAKEA